MPSTNFLEDVCLSAILDRPTPIPGQGIPGLGHLQELVALRAFGNLLGERPAFLSVLAVLGCLLHRSYPCWPGSMGDANGPFVELRYA
jgi:hypothetical protein